MWRRWWVGAAGVTAFGVCLLIAGAAYERYEERRALDCFPRLGQLVDAGGHLQYLCTSGQGSPTVVLDSGLGVSSYGWQAVHHGVSQFARVCAYDRAGYGLSEPGPMPRTSSRIAEELHTMLVNAGLAPPYVLVGHSFGGFTTRVFTGRYPAEVAGMVLVDASSEHQFNKLPDAIRKVAGRQERLLFWARFLAPFGIHRVVAALQSGEPPRWANQAPLEYHAAGLNWSRAPFLSTVYSELATLEESGREAKAAGDLGDRPLIVLTAGARLKAQDLPAGISLAEAHEFQRVWADELQPQLALLSTRGSQRFADKSGHMIPLEQPEAIVKAIRDVVTEVRAGQVSESK